MKSLSMNYLPTSCTLIGFSLLLLLSFMVLPLNASAAVDIDTSGDGRAAAFDGEEGIATEGDSFCSITDDIAGGKFSSLFEGIVGDCENKSLNPLLVEYSFTKNPVKVGEKSYLTVTVKDKETGNPISDAFVTLDIKPPSSTSTAFETSIAGAAVAAAGISSPNQEVKQDKTTQAMHTDDNGRATFTVQIGPKSDLGTYDTELEITKDSYQSSFEQIDFRIV